MTAVKLETTPLFVRADEDLSGITPIFSRSQIENMGVWKESYSIPLGAGGTCYRYNVRLPNAPHGADGSVISISRNEDNEFYGDAIALINEYVKSYPESNAAKWVAHNARELNIAKHYWKAIDSLEKAELYRLKANLRALDAKAYADGNWGLTDEQRKLAVVEFGYDPERSWDINE